MPIDPSTWARSRLLDIEPANFVLAEEKTLPARFMLLPTSFEYLDINPTSFGYGIFASYAVVSLIKRDGSAKPFPTAVFRTSVLIACIPSSPSICVNSKIVM